MVDTVSILMAAQNVSSVITETLNSILSQEGSFPVEICVYDDNSSDNTLQLLEKFSESLVGNSRFSMKIASGQYLGIKEALGPGFARNRAFELASGNFICIVDSDDVCVENRLLLQLALCKENIDSVVGSLVSRIPEDATPKYTNWANSIPADDLDIHAWRECPIFQPTWFFHRSVFEYIGGYDEIVPPISDLDVLVEKEWLRLSSDPSIEKFDSRISRKYPLVVATRSCDWSKLRKESFVDYNDLCLGNVDLPSFSVSADDRHYLSIEEDKCQVSLSSLSRSSDIIISGHCLAQINGTEPPRLREGIPILSRPPLKLHPSCLVPSYSSETPDVVNSDRLYRPCRPLRLFGEDPVFLRRHLSHGGRLRRIDAPLVKYRFDSDSVTFNTSHGILLAVRVAMFEESMLWSRIRFSNPVNLRQDDFLTFSSNPALKMLSISDIIPPVLLSKNSNFRKFFIWNAGRDGKAFYKCLSPFGRSFVHAFVDIDPKKIGLTYPVAMKRPNVKDFTEGEVNGKKRFRSESDRLDEFEDSPKPIIHYSALSDSLNPLKFDALLKKKRDCGFQPQNVDNLDQNKGSVTLNALTVVCLSLDSGGQELQENIANSGLLVPDDVVFMF